MLFQHEHDTLVSYAVVISDKLRTAFVILYVAELVLLYKL